MTTLAQHIGLTSDQAQAIVSRAFDLVDAGELEGAVDIFKGLLVLDPADATMHASLGSVFHQQGKLSEARAAYDTALSLDANTVLARVNRGELRCKRGDLDGIDDLKIAAQLPSPVQGRAQSLLRLYAR
ncbi:MAG: tetratricopeptide repeat protein [Archangium sp.]|nr:tetratricopeptide repeat protein [Archangium sp.]